MNKIEQKRDNQDKLSDEVEQTLSPKRGVLRVILGVIALLLWILIGISPTVIFSSALQQFIGFTSFFYRNPIAFLLIALFNIFLGFIVYFTIAIYYWSAFHFIWSIRWFYGYGKYRKVKMPTETKLKS